MGIFGFLTLENENISGNQGLWDQLGGLKWIKHNIAAFGGNPNKGLKYVVSVCYLIFVFEMRGII